MQRTDEPQLVDLGFELVPPTLPLRPYIRSYWSMRRDTPLHVYRQERMHPAGGFGVVFNFGDVVWLDGQAITKPVFLDGANTISRQMGMYGRVDLLGIRFHEGGAYPFLGVPLQELRNQIDLLSAMNNAELVRLHARLHDATHTTRVQLLDTWLLGRAALGKTRNALVPASLQRMRAGQLAIPELARDLAVSQRQLERVYQSQVGMSPKQCAQLRRVEAARLALTHEHQHSTSYLAVELGFYDQSHFIREFRAVIGETPYASQKRKHNA